MLPCRVEPFLFSTASAGDWLAFESRYESLVEAAIGIGPMNKAFCRLTEQVSARSLPLAYVLIRLHFQLPV